MLANKNDEAQFWDKIARKYAADQIKDMVGHERTVERSRHLLSPSADVIEIGCGTGTIALKLASSVSRILATDASSEMIAIAQEKALALGCQNASFTVASADQVPGSDGAYDAALAFSVLHLVTRRRATLAHVHALLKPGGVFISKTPCLSEMNVLIRYAVPVARMVGKAPHVSFFTAPELEAEIASAGFTIIEQARHGSDRKDPLIFIVARKSEA